MALPVSATLKTAIKRLACIGRGVVGSQRLLRRGRVSEGPRRAFTCSGRCALLPRVCTVSWLPFPTMGSLSILLWHHVACTPLGLFPSLETLGCVEPITPVSPSYVSRGLAFEQELLQRLRKKGNRKKGQTISADDVRRATSKLQVLGSGFAVRESTASSIAMDRRRERKPCRAPAGGPTRSSLPLGHASSWTG